MYRIALTEELKILSALDEEILTLITEEHIEDEIRESGIFRESIHEMIVRIDETLNAVEVENSGHTDKSISHYPSNSNSFTEGLGAGRAKLPKITLKKFYGDPIPFTPFWDSFKSTVDDNPSLSDIDKFNYLRSLLEGSAAGAIRGLPLTAENYGAAKDILKKRFGQPQIIINAHMEGLVKWRPTFEPSKPWGYTVSLVEKLPPNTRLIISRAIDQPEWDLDVLLKAFDSEIEARERCESIGTNPSDSFTPKRPFSSQANKGKDVPTGATLTNQSEHPISCTFCKQSHPSASCGTVTDIGARRNLLKQQGRCFICLRRNHLARNCSLNKACRICSGNHHMSICENANRGNGTSEIQSRGSSVVVSDRGERRSNENKSSTMVYVDLNTSILLQTAIAPVSVVHQWHPVVNVRILFDSGSQRSYLSERAKAKLNLLPKGKEKLLIKTFGQENEQLKECDVAEFCVRGLSESSKVQMTALAVPLICSPLKDQAVQFAQPCYSHLADLELADHPTEDWFRIKKFWEIESIGVSPHEGTVHDKFLDTIRACDGRYEVSLPWKEQHALLPDNYALAVSRLASVLKRLRGNPKLFAEYNRIIEEQSLQGIISDVDPHAPVQVGRLHYLPHHPVVREDKQTTKVRIVYDASAKSTGPSLNDCLHAGPSLISDIPDVLMRFRYHQIALAADIEKAFLMVQVAKADRDFLRFLWINDPTSEDPNIVVKRFNRVVFGVTSSPFLLNGTVRHHVSNYKVEDPQFVNDFLSSLYVDDFNGGKDSVHEAFQLYSKAKSRMKEGGFNLRKWISNSEKLMQWINQEEGVPIMEASMVSEEDKTYTQTQLGVNNSTISCERKILGLNWNIEKDTFMFYFDWLVQFARELPLNKCSVLKVVAKLYDPLGLISPLFITVKALFQDLCKLKIGWDKPLDEELTLRYSSWLSDLLKVKCIPIERRYVPNSEENVISLQIHGFGDSSEVAYAAVVYLRIETNEGAYTQLVMSKTRVAPLAKQTIPRLELLAALILSRLINRVRVALLPVIKVDEVYCWTDSMTKLHWIKGVERNYKQFVENRVREIRQNVPPESWGHCPGIENPADLPSRGMKAEALKQSEIWWHGPPWLVEGKEMWPKFENTTEPPSVCFDEMRVSDRPNNCTELVVTVRAPALSSVFYEQRYSDIKRLFRVTAFVLRFLHNLKSRKNGMAATGPLSTDEYGAAEILWLREMQQAVVESPRFESLKYQLGLYTDDNGLLRCKGRLQNATIPFNAKYPILLPADHYLTALIIHDCHKRVLHNGSRETLAELRSRFWIVRGRQVVRKVLSRCVICKRIEGQHYAIPPTAPLPQFRVEESPVFTNSGIDFVGPLFVKSGAKEKGDMEKIYIALYTCGSSRAVHLDVVPDLTAETFIRSFKRFICRRGIPRLVVSDNAKTFKTTAKFLSSIFELPEVQNFLLNHKVKWRFNLERAPWWGGFFERMVRCVKRCLKKILKSAKLTYEELLTVVVEIECVLNSRPLTYVSSEDRVEPLTPSHLLTGRRLLSIPDEPIVAEEKSSDVEILTRRQRYVTLLLSHFWNRWKKEYVVELREHHRALEKGAASNSSSIQTGDIVTEMEEGKSNRGMWRLGKILDVHPGNDGLVRGATIEVASDNGKRRRLRRPYRSCFR
ncbi:uncharacterized protein LOC122963962 [Acropora millepora]|uniref:uncharacterized protein LOC122963962 n=1 Tax=Acropora millepora TaxID=45264 RepID=UPI001CF3B44F|nr:uncharacterized protein LOC122963962 [Acropora millepora]